MKNLIIFLFVVITLSCNQSRPDIAKVLSGGKWIDLSWDFDENTVYWPTDVPFKHDTVFYGLSEKGYFYSTFKYAAEEHGGTHFDSPLHFLKGGRSIEQVPVTDLTGMAVVIDVSGQSTKDRDYLVRRSDFVEWEKKYGVIPEHSIVLLHTGYGKFWNDHEKYTGTLKTGVAAVAELHFPGLDAEAADWLAKERKIKAVGIDTPSIDFGQSKDFKAHISLCSNNITIYENVANLEQVPATGGYLIAAPMKIKGGSGSPLRLLAWVKDI